jgi:hypothetical protein
MSAEEFATIGDEKEIFTAPSSSAIFAFRLPAVLHENGEIRPRSLRSILFVGVHPNS